MYWKSIWVATMKWVYCMNTSAYADISKFFYLEVSIIINANFNASTVQHIELDNYKHSGLVIYCGFMVQHQKSKHYFYKRTSSLTLSLHSVKHKPTYRPHKYKNKFPRCFRLAYSVSL